MMDRYINFRVDMKGAGKNNKTGDYPYLNKDLEDLPGEQWKDIPYLEGLYRISNLGRVKRLKLEILCSNGFYRQMQPKIMNIDISIVKNKGVGDLVYFPACAITREGIKYKFSLPRLLYYCFKKKFDLDNYHLVVYSKDGNGKNMALDNLELVDLRRKQQRIHERGRLIREFYTAIDEYHDTGKIKSENIFCRQVSQYDLNGKKIKTFPSINVAGEVTGINPSLIVAVLKRRQVSTCGFVWGYGTTRKIDVAAIRAEGVNNRNKLVGTKVSQYNLKGFRVAVFDTIAEARRQFNSSGVDIPGALSGRQKSAGGFIWRRGIGKLRISVNGLVGEELRAQRKWKVVKQYDSQGKLMRKFESVKKAAGVLGISESYVSMLVNNNMDFRGTYLRFG